MNLFDTLWESNIPFLVVVSSVFVKGAEGGGRQYDIVVMLSDARDKKRLHGNFRCDSDDPSLSVHAMTDFEIKDFKDTMGDYEKVFCSDNGRIFQPKGGVDFKGAYDQKNKSEIRAHQLSVLGFEFDEVDQLYYHQLVSIKISAAVLACYTTEGWKETLKDARRQIEDFYSNKRKPTTKSRKGVDPHRVEEKNRKSAMLRQLAETPQVIEIRS